MEGEKVNTKQIAIFTLLAIAFLIVANSLPYLVSLSVISTYQGIHPEFYGVKYQNKYYTSTTPYGASSYMFSPSSMNFDPDGVDWGKPNLCGETKDIHIITDPKYANPYKTYEWRIPDPSTGDVHVYRMELWLCRFQVNVWVSIDARDALEAFRFDDEQDGQRYIDTDVWLRLGVSPSWYFEGADRTFFGLAYMELEDFTIRDGDPNIIEVIPEAQWAALPIYYSAFGTQETLLDAEQQAQTYQGKLLNPEVFRTEWYTTLTMRNFGVEDWWTPLHGWKGESVQFVIFTHVFVVGEWVVKPEIERTMETHQAQTALTWLDKLWIDIGSWFSNPLNTLISVLIMAFVAIVILIIIFPMLLTTKIGKALMFIIALIIIIYIVSILLGGIL
jgi:hypothetical protein